tara:strand:+ start:747 stop:1610 length:864 start_codon:yes stop_codon:yes gene_type:complete
MIKISKTETTPVSEMTGLTWYFIGPPKSGKTTNACAWSKEGNKTLLLDTDKGSDFMAGQDVIHIEGIVPPKLNGEILDPEKRNQVYRSGSKKGEPMPVYSMGEVLTGLMTGEVSTEYETIVIDTVDKLNEWSEAKVKHDLGIDDISDAGFGKGWSTAKTMVCNMIDALQTFCKNNGMNLVMISHAKESMMVDGKVQLGPEMPKGLSKKLTAMSDAIGFATFDRESQSPVLSFESYDERAVGSRIPALHNKVFPFDYNAIMKATEEKKETKTTKKVTITTEKEKVNAA